MSAFLIIIKRFSLCLALASTVVSISTGSSNYSDEASFVQFDNVGYDGRYFHVSKVEALNDDNCSCLQDLDNAVSIDSVNAPYNEELSVHLRGPMNLRKFAWYVADDYTYGSTSGSWTRGAYYDSEEGTADNVTFLGNVGDDNLCLGRALNYVTSNGTALASDSTVLDNITVASAHEYAIYSSKKCSDSSSSSGDCGVYREGIDAYHGFYGTVKAFLFEFYSPTDNSEEDLVNKTSSYDMPAIWLLNAEIPRTAQYPTNGNCSSWNTGAGEFDIFEVMNVTERNHFYSTIHDFQGIDDLGTGIQMFAYLDRTPNSVMKGGIVFGGDGTATVFLSNSTTFDDTLENSDLNSWISSLKNEEGGEVSESLADITLGAEITTTASSAISGASSATGSKGDAVRQTGGSIMASIFAMGALLL
ncbi:hypothetical protein FOA43_004295 [Brettanomyces nanus]|uniref:glucan endo-1,3-beta-D-glucosidase n=1 Tax=Eeniella nana TaxID=13502 RepID=A0A875S5J6_EENNA|nr:uncharacterized protein FOA43_004295 [Brettanomyces nanus]QPG76901.1 hypothetical protein FOA43_004295 [Brettanomyces nanus]